MPPTLHSTLYHPLKSLLEEAWGWSSYFRIWIFDGLTIINCAQSLRSIKKTLCNYLNHKMYFLLLKARLISRLFLSTGEWSNFNADSMANSIVKLSANMNQWEMFFDFNRKQFRILIEVWCVRLTANRSWVYFIKRNLWFSSSLEKLCNIIKFWLKYSSAFKNSSLKLLFKWFQSQLIIVFHKKLLQL